MTRDQRQKLLELIAYSKKDPALKAIVPQLLELSEGLSYREGMIADMHLRQGELVGQLKQVLQCLLEDEEVPKEVVKRVLRVCNAYDIASKITKEQA